MQYEDRTHIHLHPYWYIVFGALAVVFLVRPIVLKTYHDIKRLLNKRTQKKRYVNSSTQPAPQMHCDGDVCTIDSITTEKQAPKIDLEKLRVERQKRLAAKAQAEQEEKWKREKEEEKLRKQGNKLIEGNSQQQQIRVPQHSDDPLQNPWARMFKDPVQALSSSDIFRIMRGNELWVVNFYSLTCVHCKNFEPIYRAFGVKMQNKQNSKINVGSALYPNCQEAASSLGIRGFPTVKLFYKGKVEDFNMPRTVDNLERSAESFRRKLDPW
ncbi:MAG: hypothetical protein EZS28_006042 [Streblomastix strix]|uniref:Thioredoxin domain-containing protein n=1 Tax=Streblomastix strix TaxID=222440 RepID=A0A5J4WTX1_9EUKA|nr:MAG: hypothetical protein EZS28_006042 [Streblomastix strix]